MQYWVLCGPKIILLCWPNSIRTFFEQDSNVSYGTDRILSIVIMKFVTNPKVNKDMLLP